MEPVKPADAPKGPPRPKGCMKSGLKGAENGTEEAGTNGSTGMLIIPGAEFRDILTKLRTNELLGPAAADALEAAAGLRTDICPQSPSAKKLRNEVAESRDEAEVQDSKKEKKKGGAMMFSAEPVEEIPDIPDKAPEPASAKKRASLDNTATEENLKSHDVEAHEAESPKDAPEPPELNLNPKQNKLRTDLEMWMMDEIPVLYGVDDSEELDESLQEDGQALQTTLIISEESPEKQRNILEDWLKNPPDDGAKGAFIDLCLEKVSKIIEAGPKKKKKKKKDA